MKRTAINGKVSVNGTPVSWGSVIFASDDPSAPVACARVMGGKFKLDEKTGPIIGKVKLTVSYSAADVPGLGQLELRRARAAEARRARAA